MELEKEVGKGCFVSLARPGKGAKKGSKNRFIRPVHTGNSHGKGCFISLAHPGNGHRAKKKEVGKGCFICLAHFGNSHGAGKGSL